MMFLRPPPMPPIPPPPGVRDFEFDEFERQMAAYKADWKSFDRTMTVWLYFTMALMMISLAAIGAAGWALATIVPAAIDVLAK
jgi:hypothetical protein